MDAFITSNGCDVFEYVINHGNSWISHESIMASNNNMVSSYLFSQENFREIIKIEEMDAISGADVQCSSTATEDSKDVYTFNSEECMSYKSEICNKSIPSKTLFIPHERPHQTEKPYQCDK